MTLPYAVGILSLLLSSAVAVPTNAAGPSTYPLGHANVTNSSSSSSPSNAPSKLPLYPVSTTSTGGVRTANRHFAPQKDVNLAWRTGNNNSLVTVGLSMLNTAVLLEDIDEVVAVDCTGTASVAVTFNDTAAFAEAVTEWSAMNDSFVIITNHMGDCDSELERSFFVADSDTLASFETNLTIVAQAEKSDVFSTAGK